MTIDQTEVLTAVVLEPDGSAAFGSLVGSRVCSFEVSASGKGILLLHAALC